MLCQLTADGAVGGFVSEGLSHVLLHLKRIRDISVEPATNWCLGGRLARERLASNALICLL